MPKPPLTEQTTTLLSEICPAEGKVSSTHTDTVYEMVEPLHGVLEAVEARLRQVDVLRRAADRTEEGPYAYAFFERIKQTVASAQTKCRDALSMIDGLTDTLFQLDEIGREMNTSLETHEQRLLNQDKTVSGPEWAEFQEWKRKNKTP